jgi:hypothetical protein
MEDLTEANRPDTVVEEMDPTKSNFYLVAFHWSLQMTANSPETMSGFMSLSCYCQKIDSPEALSAVTALCQEAVMKMVGPALIVGLKPAIVLLNVVQLKRAGDS